VASEEPWKFVDRKTGARYEVYAPASMGKAEVVQRLRLHLSMYPHLRRKARSRKMLTLILP